MKAVVWRGVNDLRLEDIDVPELRDEVIVRVRYTGICGSDITIKSGHHPRARAPLILGHEFCGAISFVPDSLRDRFKEGQRVVVNPLIACGVCRQCRAGNEHVCERLELIGVEHNPGAFTEYVSIPQPQRIYQLPDEISDEEAALIEPLSVAVHAADKATLAGHETALVLGAGPIGLLTAQVARVYGAHRVIVSETEASRLARARELGFEVVDAGSRRTLDAVTLATDGAGADVVFDAAGAPATAEQVIPLAGVKGRIIMVAIHKRPAEVLFRDLAYKELTIQGTRIYTSKDFQTAIELARRGEVKLAPLITHVFPVADALAAFELAETSKDACKILVRQPDEEQRRAT